jgi:hypothetical protein
VRVFTIEGVTENGQIRLNTDMRLPDNMKVFVIIPGMEVEQVPRMHSPRLAHSDQAADFEMEIVEEASGDGL